MTADTGYENGPLSGQETGVWGGDEMEYLQYNGVNECH
jgi:hypothetical protein